MGKKKGGGGSSKGAQQRTRKNPLTGQTETVHGTKAGKRRMRLAPGDPLRTHDIKGPVGKKSKKRGDN